MNIYVKLIILRTEKQNINNRKQNISYFEIQLARKITTDLLSLYRKMSSLGAPDVEFTKSRNEWTVI